MKIDHAFGEFFEDFDSFLVLEERIAPFNLFEAVGMQRAEIRHSQFLAYILDPNRPHGLGDEFLKRFLYRALKSVGSTDPAPAEMMIADFDQTNVYRERANIDVLITIGAAKVVFAIENKIGADETGDQLVRYQEWVEKEFQNDWRKVYLFLTPTGAEPSHASWMPVGYAIVAEAITSLLKSRETSLSSDVALALRHYVEMLERYVLEEDRNRNIAQQLYQKHKEVFDFVFESIPKAGDVISERCMSVVTSRPDVVPVSKLGFKSKAWMNDARFGGNVQKGVYFYFNVASETKLVLYNAAPEPSRAKLQSAAVSSGPPFLTNSQLMQGDTPILRETLLSKADTTERSPEDASILAAERLTRFLDAQLLVIDSVVLSATT